MAPDPDDTADIISSGGEGFRALAGPRCPRLARLARPRRAGIAAGGLGLAAIVAAAVVFWPRGAPEPAFPVTVPVGAVSAGVGASGGVFARGTADGHAWRLAVQDIADPGYSCLPAITINGTDADPVYPDPGNSANVSLGPAGPGIGFAFVQVPAGIEGLIIDGRESLAASTVTVCGQRYRIVGFAYPLAQVTRITAVGAHPAWPKLKKTVASVWPVATQLPPVMPGTAGMWDNVGSTSAETASAVLASARDWSILLQFGAGGDCYEFTAVTPGTPEAAACGPVSTPDGPETIMALPLGYPRRAGGPTGYALQVSPATARLVATLSDGSARLVTPRMAGGRRYAAFVVGTSLRLARLTWLDASGQVMASTTALPRRGYTQFRP